MDWDEVDVGLVLGSDLECLCELAADVKLVVLSDDRYVHLTGIVVRQPRAGWITLEIPPLESWEPPMRWLSREQRQRMESPDFYRLLQEQIGRRYLALAGPAS